MANNIPGACLKMPIRNDIELDKKHSLLRFHMDTNLDWVHGDLLFEFETQRVEQFHLDVYRERQY